MIYIQGWAEAPPVWFKQMAHFASQAGDVLLPGCAALEHQLPRGILPPMRYARASLNLALECPRDTNGAIEKWLINKVL